MATPLPMPKLGLTMEEGTILKWRKGEGVKRSKRARSFSTSRPTRSSTRWNRRTAACFSRRWREKATSCPAARISPSSAMRERTSAVSAVHSPRPLWSLSRRRRRRPRRLNPPRRPPLRPRPLRRLGLRPRDGFSPAPPQGAWPVNWASITAP